MISKDTNIKYFAYLRKSSESEDRQMQSIESQRHEMESLAKRLNLNVVEYFEESQSAKKPGRNIFNDMIARIERGEASGILVWKLNRLARNPIDGGKVIWLLQNSVIRHIQTQGAQYLPSDNVLMMYVELGMANQFLKDLSTDTKRGLRERMKRGYTHGVAPLGYLNDLSRRPGDRGWLKDPVRFGIVKQILEYYADGTFSVRQILNKINSEWHLTTPVRLRHGGKSVVRSYLYTLLANPVYAGFFYGSDGCRYELSLDVERMISVETHEKILRRLGKGSNPRSYKFENIYAEHSQCGTCSRPLVREQKRRVRCDCGHKFSYITNNTCIKCKRNLSQMENLKFHDYDYLHCTKTSKHVVCKEPVVSITDFKNQLAHYLEENLYVTPRLAEWCLKHVKELDDKELANTLAVARAKSDSLDRAQQKYNNLLTIRISKNNLSIEQSTQYDAMEQQLLSEIESFKVSGSHEEKLQKRYREITQDFNLAVEVVDTVRNGSDSECKEVLNALRSKLILKEKTLVFEPRRSLKILIDGLQSYKTEIGMFETKNPLDIQADFGVSSLGCPTLLRDQDSNLEPTP
jgi:site-specific DNA recombinase